MSKHHVHSFSVKEGAKEEADLVQYFKLRAIKNGQTFSFFVLKGLAKLKEELEHGDYKRS